MPLEISNDDVADQPPSAKLVYLVLQEAEEPLTQKDLRDQTQLPDRTLRHALERLEEVDVVDRRHSLEDARQSLYVIA